MSKQIVVSGVFDDLRSGGIRFLEEAAKLGSLHVLVWSDAAVQKFTGAAPKFPGQERSYFLSALRSVSGVHLVDGPGNPDALPDVAELCPATWVVGDGRANAAKEEFCRAHDIKYHVLGGERLKVFPIPTTTGQHAFPHSNQTAKDGDAVERVPDGRRKKVIATGCYDWFHSGHVRFCEEVSAYGDLYVVVGNDANVRALKGEGHPLFPEDERRHVVGSIRFVTQALVSTGSGWLDAEPEIRLIRPDIYAVNEDGDKGGKREFCKKNGIEYLVLKRTPAPGLPWRSSTDLRGF